MTSASDTARRCWRGGGTHQRGRRLPAPAKHSADEDVARQQFEIASDGAVAFKHWADALVITYLEVTGSHVGTPRAIEDRPFPGVGEEAG